MYTISIVYLTSPYFKIINDRVDGVQGKKNHVKSKKSRESCHDQFAAKYNSVKVHANGPPIQTTCNIFSQNHQTHMHDKPCHVLQLQPIKANQIRSKLWVHHSTTLPCKGQAT